MLIIVKIVDNINFTPLPTYSYHWTSATLVITHKSDNRKMFELIHSLLKFQCKTMYKILTFLSLFLIKSSYGSDILVIISTPSFSHQAPLRPIWKELALRGHNVTLITTDPMNNSSLAIKEIDISYGYQIIQKHQVFGKFCLWLKHNQKFDQN